MLPSGSRSVARRRWQARTPSVCRLTLAVALLGASLLGFAKLASDVLAGDPIVGFDSAVAVWLHGHSMPALTVLFLAVTQLGSTLVLVVGAVAAVAALAARRRLADAALVATAIAGGELLDAVLKAIVHRGRPEFADPIATAGGYSFPSGHAMAALTLYGALAYVIARRVGGARRRAVWVGLALAVVVLVGVSRVYLGVHYLSDVLAGYAAGAAWLLLCILAVSLGGVWAGRGGQPPSTVANAA